ncbi:Kievitone hydratase [Fusarium ambrosium]|uniref:Kievitone hydratase n=1 Tax=Fusarium ambrosium TaxID=131363 RepID=A0A428UKJ5_9HYPO|nr:Kievitone hydratase [Fusarium ambrosium]
MHASVSLVACLATATVGQAKSVPKKFAFKPENSKTTWTNSIPIVYGLGESQPNSVGGSWWSSSYITTTNNEQYVVLAHYLDNPAYTYFRASTLNLETNGYYQYVTVGSGTPNITTLDVNVGNNGIKSESEDNLSKLRSYSNHDNVTFDITYDATTGAVANGGAGVFQFGDGLTWEFGLPSCKTQGSLTAHGEKLTIDPSKSQTWYDRQWGNTAAPPSNWTWFQLHIPSTDYKVSAWIFPDPFRNTETRFATIRGANDEIQVLPLEFTPIYKRTYESGTGRVTYPLDWKLKISGFGDFKVSSYTEDQELVGEDALQTAYEGFITFSGNVHSKPMQGYGLVEIVYSTWDV